MLRRSQLSLIALVLLTVTLGSAVYFYQATRLVDSPGTPWYRLPAPCTQPESVLADLATLASLMHDTLARLKAPHALCYGTLWGALRQGRTLAWDNNVDMCSLDLHVQHVPTAQLLETFRDQGGDGVDYDWTRATYVFSYRQVRGRLHLFTKIKGQQGQELAVPGGWSRAVWRWFGSRQLSFPLWLLEAPFHAQQLHGRDMPVPHDGIELLKYLYPDDWWQELHPPGCE